MSPDEQPMTGSIMLPFLATIVWRTLHYNAQIQTRLSVKWLFEMRKQAGSTRAAPEYMFASYLVYFETL